MKWGSFAYLYLLWALIPITLWLVYLVRRRERRLETVTAPEVLHLLTPRRLPARIRTRQLAWITALALCLISLARPQWGYRLEEVSRRGLDIIVVLDTSKSMLATDIRPNRLQQSKWGIKDLVKRLSGDRIGLMAFAGGSYLQCPLTSDYAAFMMMLEDVYAGIIPRGGTAIGQALRKALQSFETDRNADRVILLITDGEDHEGKVAGVIKELKKEKVKVFALGAGSLEGEIIPTEDEKGRINYLKNKQGVVVKSSLQEDVLEQLAIETGGMYVRARSGDFGLDRIIDEGLTGLLRDEIESRTIKSYEDRFIWFLFPAFLLLVFEAFLSERMRAPKQEAMAR